MRGAGDNYGSAQEGVGCRRHPGPLSILLKHINRNRALVKLSLWHTFVNVLHPLEWSVVDECDLGRNLSQI